MTRQNPLPNLSSCFGQLCGNKVLKSMHGQQDLQEKSPRLETCVRMWPDWVGGKHMLWPDANIPSSVCFALFWHCNKGWKAGRNFTATMNLHSLKIICLCYGIAGPTSAACLLASAPLALGCELSTARGLWQVRTRAFALQWICFA